MIPAVECDFCECVIQPNEESLVFVSQPYRHVMCAYCKRRLEETISLLIEIDERERTGNEPRLEC